MTTDKTPGEGAFRGGGDQALPLGHGDTRARARRKGTAGLAAMSTTDVNGSTFTGTFSIPKFKNCGLLMFALNLLIPGDGNTFTATASPKPAA